MWITNNSDIDMQYICTLLQIDIHVHNYHRSKES